VICGSCGARIDVADVRCEDERLCHAYADALIADECEERVIAKIRERRAAGRVKYGCTMERTDLTRLDWLNHAQEEAMDLAIYLERLIEEEASHE
jgi:hypothetical protein